MGGLEGESGGGEETEDVEAVGGGDENAFQSGRGEEGARIEVVWGAELEEAAVLTGVRT